MTPGAAPARPRPRGRRLAPATWAGLALVALLAAVAALAPWVSSGRPEALDLDRGLTASGAPRPPSADAPLGTDDLGRDVWARVAAGAGASLTIAGGATALALLIGVPIGLWAGHRGGRVDEALMRGVDLALAFPLLLLAMLLAALLRETRLAGTTAPLCLALGATGWTTVARVVRARAAVVSRADHVVAARALGAGPGRVLGRHVLPHLGGAIGAVAASLAAQDLLAEAALSYVGLGPTRPTWGRMLLEGRAYYRTAPWLVAAPGAAIALAVLAFTLLGRGLEEARR